VDVAASTEEDAMTKFVRRVFLLVTVCLLASAAPAFGECAWVLWKSTEHSGFGSPFEPKVTTVWEIKRSVPEHAICEEVLEAVWRIEVNSEKERQGPRFRLNWDDRAVGWYGKGIGPPGIGEWYQEVQYKCLPDTIDPRGPKPR
jgi:hypothetical protein